MINKKQQMEKEACFPVSITLKAALLNEQNKFLLLKRAENQVNGGKWDLPGGTWEASELLEEGLKREIKEETNLDVEVLGLVGTAEYPLDGRNFEHEKIGLRYAAQASGGEIKLNPAEHSEYKWLSLEEAKNVLSLNDGFELEKINTLKNAANFLHSRAALNNLKRVLADWDNFRKRAEREKEEYRYFLLSDFAQSLLPVIDNFDSAMEHIPKDIQHNQWTAGIVQIKKQLEKLLSDLGAEEIIVQKGDKFDEKIHESAIGEKKDNLENIIDKVLKKGYRIGDKTIRPAMVQLV